MASTSRLDPTDRPGEPHARCAGSADGGSSDGHPLEARNAKSGEREDIKRLAWYSTEFGLIREEEGLKAFGAGRLSSIAELESVMSGAVPVLPLTVENVIPHEKSVWSHNDVTFVIESVDQLARELERYFARLQVSPDRGSLSRRGP